MGIHLVPNVIFIAYCHLNLCSRPVPSFNWLRSEDLWESLTHLGGPDLHFPFILVFYYSGSVRESPEDLLIPGDWTQVVRLGSKHPYPLTHLVSPQVYSFVSRYPVKPILFVEETTLSLLKALSSLLKVSPSWVQVYFWILNHMLFSVGLYVH